MLSFAVANLGFSSMPAYAQCATRHSSPPVGPSVVGMGALTFGRSVVWNTLTCSAPRLWQMPVLPNVP